MACFSAPPNDSLLLAGPETPTNEAADVLMAGCSPWVKNPCMRDEARTQKEGLGPEAKAVVVGGGLGGLALAIRLQAAGLSTTILEKRPQLGGRAYQLRDRGYVFDMGPSLIAAPGILQSLFRAAGREMSDYLSMIRLEPYYRLHFHDGTHLDYVGEAKHMKAQMRAFNAQDADRFDSFMKAVRPIYDAVIAGRLGSASFDKVGKMTRVLPRLIRMRAFRHVTDVVEHYFEDFRHRIFFSFHPLFIGGNPFLTPAIYLVIPALEREGDVWFPLGGVYTVVESLSALFRELGGEIRTSQEVTRIVVEDGRATGVEIETDTLAADVVVSNADVGHTYGDLVAREARHHWTDRRLKHLHYSMSCFVLYLGVGRRYTQLRHHTLIVSEHYERQLESIFEAGVLPEDLSLWVHAPTVSDPSMAPEGCECLHVIVPVPNKASGLVWEEEAPRLADRVLDALEAWGMEGLRDNIEVMHLFTPDDFESELNAPYGNAFSVDPRLTQTGWFRPHGRSEDVENLYLVGAGTHPGAGVPGVLLSAEATFDSIASDVGLPAAPDHHLPGVAEMDVNPGHEKRESADLRTPPRQVQAFPD